MPKEQRELSILKQAYLKIEELQARLDAVDQAQREPLAIIGMACRFPGEANDPAAFWQLLSEGRDAVTDIPDDRWDVDAYFDLDRSKPGKMYMRSGAFLRQVDQFDPQFFGISPREAVKMDPQQRLLLEVCWEALENAGVAPDRLNGSRTGVFVGLCKGDYRQLLAVSEDPDRFDAYYISGTAKSIASGRLSYILGLQGPSITVDTACSSSLVALHLGCQSLRSGECAMTLVAGVNLILSPENTITYCKCSMMAADGRCKTFDAGADGFVQGEGCGVVVLKRLSAALADGNRILALIRGTAVNQDGPSSGLTAPHGPSQVAVIREALANSGVSPSEVQYVEAHGTGTSLGDPIEVQAIGAALREGRPPEQPVLIGSVKTNIGHLEAAAGIAGLIKVVLALQHKEIPAHLHCKTLSSYIPWSELPVKVATERTPWVAANGKRIAGISSFGFSGTNAHAILEEAPALTPAVVEPERPIHLLALSAKNEAALKSLSGKFAEFLATDPSVSVPDFCFTANAGRAHFGHRLAIVVESVEQIREKLAAAAAGEAPSGILTGQRENTDRPKIAFLFTGQGSQYQGMGRQLYQTEPAFRETLERCDELLRSYLPISLLSLLYGEKVDPALLNQTANTQPALFSLEYALAQMWISWGIVPDIVLGHSLGEYVAACIAGVFGLDDGIRLVAERGRIMKTLCPRGEMAAIFTEEERVRVALVPYADAVSIAAINGPKHVVISGATDAVGAVLKHFESQGIMAQPLAVSHAFHSQLIEPMLDAFTKTAAKVAYAAPRMGLVSNLTGELAKPAGIASADYWCRHLREPVRFSSSIATLFEKGYELLLEVGPTPTLLGMGKRCVPRGKGTWVPSLSKGRDDWEQILESLGTLYVRGAQVDWAGFDRAYLRRRLSLPTYPFQRKRYWIPEEKARSAHDAPLRAGRHPMLERRMSSPVLKETIFESQFSLGALPFADEHRVFGMAVLPAAAYLEMVNAAATEALGVGVYTLEDIDIREALSLQDEEVRTVQLIFSPAEDEALAFQVLSFVSAGDDKTPYTLHAAGKVLARQEVTDLSPAAVAIAEIQGRCPHEASMSAYYRRLETLGIHLGDRFRSVEKLWRGSNEALGLIKLTAEAGVEASGYTIHPAMLDACLQIVVPAIFDGAELESNEQVFLPMGMERFILHRSVPGELWSHVTVAPRANGSDAFDTVVGDMHVYDLKGELVAELHRLHLKRAQKEVVLQRAQPSFVDWLYEVAWQPERGASREVGNAGFLLAPTEIARRVEPSVRALSAKHGLDIYEEFLPELDKLCAAYIFRAMQRLGWEPRLYERISVASLAARLGIVNSQHRLLNRFLSILQEEGMLKSQGAAWEVARLPEAIDIENKPHEILKRFPQGEAELTLVKRGGENLAAALRGEIDPAQVLFPDGSFDMADKLYRESPTANVFNTLARESVRAALARLPKDRTIRVLEIGAGTGGTTSFVLSEFPPERTEYTFTDLSQFFLSQARERFAAYPFLHYRILNIEQNPSRQGFAPHQFDLIIAAGVLHATADLRRTLAHVNQLLAPEGILMLLEVTRPQRWIDLSFGLTEGWWLFTDVDLRPSHPLLTQGGWTALLGETGFTDAVAIPEEDTGGASAQNALVLARAPKSDGVEDATALPGSWLIFADQAGVGERLGQFLQAHNQTPIVVVPGEAFGVIEPGRFMIDPTRAEGFQRLIREVCGDGQPPCRGAVYLWSLNDIPTEAMTSAALIEEQTHGTRGVLNLVQALATSAVSHSPKLWLVTRRVQAVGKLETVAAAHAPLWGMAKVIDLEHPELHCVCVDLDQAQREADDTEQSARALFDEISCSSGESEIAFRNQQRYVSRLMRFSGGPMEAERCVNNVVDPSFQLVVKKPGILDSLQLQPAERRCPGPGEVEIRVHAAGLNFHDVLYALGMLNDTEALGGECAGTVVAVGDGVTEYRVGDEVIAVAADSFGTFAVANTLLVVPKPKQIGFTEAAAFPLVFLTAYFALHRVGRMQRGERLLIHSAAGGVGQAAIQLAQRAGVEIFATASTPEKRDFLRSLGIRNVMNSRSLEFADEIRRVTHGEGIDLVLNSLTGEAIPKSLELLRKGGRFLEIGKTEIWDEHRVSKINPHATYHPIDLSKILMSDPASIRPTFVQLMAELADGVLKLPSITTFAFEDGPNAFRYMAQGKHIGKVVLTQDAEARRPGTLDSSASYLVTGGLRGLGLLTAEWLVKHGARHLVLIGRSSASAEASETLTRLENSGTQIRTMQGDVSIEEDVRSIFDEVQRTMPPLRGVIHAAGTLADGVLLQQDWTRFREVMASKIAGAWHLHSLTKEIPLDFFVLFSSIAAILGAAGQANHAAANSFMDALAHHRHALHLPALSINWGVWSEVGAAAERNVDVRALAQGMGSFSPQHGLQVLEYLLAQRPTQVAVMPVNWSKFLSQDRSDRRRHFFAAVAEGTAVQTEAGQWVQERKNLRLQLEQASPKKRHLLLLEYVREQAVKVLSLDPSQSIDPKEPLTHLGLDSLMAVELRNLLGAGLNLTRNFPATLVFDYPTLAALTGYLAKEVFGWHNGDQNDAAPAERDGLSDLLGDLEELSEQEVDRLFAERTERQ